MKTSKDSKITISFTLIWRLRKTIVATLRNSNSSNLFRHKSSQIMQRKKEYRRRRKDLIKNNRNYQVHTKVDKRLKVAKTIMDWAIHLILWRHLKCLIVSQHAQLPQSMNTNLVIGHPTICWTKFPIIQSVISVEIKSSEIFMKVSCRLLQVDLLTKKEHWRKSWKNRQI